MNRRTPHRHIDFLSAVRRGMSTQVRRQLQSYYFADETFYDEENDVEVYPFEVALEHKRWRVALDILEHRDVNDRLLPPGVWLEEEEAEKSQIDPGPADSGTPLKRSLTQLLSALSRHRHDRPLPKSLRDRMLPFLDILVEQDGLDKTLLRALAFNLPWLDWSGRLLKAGANPNAWAAHKYTGKTIHTLELAARNGLERQLEELLEEGADPHYKHHDFELASHRAARLTQGSFARDWMLTPPSLALDILLARKRCMDRLVKAEGGTPTPGLDGKTPQQIWDEDIDPLLDRLSTHLQDLPQKDLPGFMERIMELRLTKGREPDAPDPFAVKRKRMRL